MRRLTSQSFAARTCCSSPDYGWCVPALWQCRPAVHRLWRAARSCRARPPAALTSTVRTDTVMSFYKINEIDLGLICFYFI